MGLPTRLHGIAVADLPKAVNGFCPKCISIKEWKIVIEKDKIYKRCVKCGQKKEIKEPEIEKLAAEEKARKSKKKASQKRATKK